MSAKPAPLAEPVTVAKISKNRRRTEAVHIGLSEYEGHNLINVRVYATGTDGIDRPTTRGISMSVRKLPELARAIVKAEAEARRLGLLDGGADHD
ncbi:transcriptional coactivator p15/PC4 family protein [Bradyrhizobium sp. Pa8]|uniref:transcriptional coactivator p15/PC4 family protein n=1 Tax=Bradyrhizobium sp. Pa8 TaxID=3386552 RepID=UPI00403F5984